MGDRFCARSNPIPPHIEDVIVKRATKLSEIENLTETLMRNAPIWRGSKNSMFEGAIRFTENGTGYVSHEAGISRCSVGFYLTEGDLFLNNYNGKNSYVSQSHQTRFTYVGFQDPLEEIPAHSLIRVSLARWWRKDDSTPERCYVQLSGWYL